MDLDSDSSASPRRSPSPLPSDISPAPQILEPDSLSMMEGACLTKVELRVSCKGISDREDGGKPETCVVLNIWSQGQWDQVRPESRARPETIK
uniref:Uncharacterized protein n=1 Tax=Knipowitschia caucasica TaxID=637954 RepID=A0AAV2ME17_KNICA